MLIVLASRVVVNPLTCRYQLSKEESLNGVFIGNHVHGGIPDVVIQHTKQLTPKYQWVNFLPIFFQINYIQQLTSKPRNCLCLAICNLSNYEISTKNFHNPFSFGYVACCF